MIDPLATVIRHLLNNSNLANQVQGRIAAKHKFGMGGATAWPLPSKALTIQPDIGGRPDLYVGWQTPRLEARCYGASQDEAAQVYRLLMDITRGTSRAVAPTADGNALLYWLVPDSSPAFVFDQELNIDLAIVFLRAAVAEEAVL